MAETAQDSIIEELTKSYNIEMETVTNCLGNSRRWRRPSTRSCSVKSPDRCQVSRWSRPSRGCPVGGDHR